MTHAREVEAVADKLRRSRKLFAAFRFHGEPDRFASCGDMVSEMDLMLSGLLEPKDGLLVDAAKGASVCAHLAKEGR